MAVIDRAPDVITNPQALPADRSPRKAITQAVNEGADLIEIGGRVDGSASPMIVNGVIQHVVPTVEWARETHPYLVVSVDTDHRDVAEQASVAGADVLSDSGAVAHSGVLDVAVRYGSGYVCTDNADSAERVAAIGVPRDGILVRLAVDSPGAPVGPSIALRHLRRLVDANWPVLIDIAGRTPATPAQNVTFGDGLADALAVTALAAKMGVAVVRTRHVQQARHAVEMVASILGTRPPARAERWLV